MQFSAYAAEWLKGQRHQGPPSLRMLESTLKHHLLPTFGSRRAGTSDHKVVEAFVGTMERDGACLAAQTRAFVRLKMILLDAHRLGPSENNPVDGVQPPQYDPKHAVIPPRPAPGDPHRRRRRAFSGRPPNG
ncbi:hypothetical protein Kpho02_74330 [Kitasatospora phosalacinea]|uniref:Integrase SAM-like N-terminal domain-containing protein n=1 Tax=Kitasatospora phosalacinea TaxID=2065 RepID=A0A9W6V4W7_9ACTN|nr:hypothetical protein [Kitasatospora phosalacinea]GLW75136.1 hypothetical protein Kpho02_74330 [Kitasatospora phosalacinea]